MRTLSRDQARRVYDRIGSWQDSQAFYEDGAVQELVRRGKFGEAHRVFELGCGTGRFAEMLLKDFLPSSSSYRGMDISPTMVGLASQRLSDFSNRVEVTLSDGSPPVNERHDRPDRFVANYVLDLLSDSDIDEALGSAHTMLEPGGLLCLTSLSFAPRWSSRFILGCWSLLRSIHPAVVGGCRPLSIRNHLDLKRWKIEEETTVVQFGVPSQVVIASPI